MGRRLPATSATCVRDPGTISSQRRHAAANVCKVVRPRFPSYRTVHIVKIKIYKKLHVERTPKLTSIAEPVADVFDFPLARWVAAVKGWDAIRRNA